jgi:glycyl-tRNA synthetase beta chain
VPDLLLEIGTEEIPASYIEPALAALKKATAKLLSDNGFISSNDVITLSDRIVVTGTPRRLILSALDLPLTSKKSKETVKGPPLDRAFDAEGQPTKAAEGFAKKNGLKVSDLKKEKDYLWADVSRGGEKLAAFLEKEFPRIIGGLVFPKSMRWIPGEKISFARPVHNLLCLLGSKIIALKFAGITAGRHTSGHPFHSPEKISLPDADYKNFLTVLKENKVLADIESRRQRVRMCVEKGAEKSGGKPFNRSGVTDDLIDEVTNLIEWPGAVMGSFDEATCKELPDEVIVAAMTGHQRYFPVVNDSGNLLPCFVSIANRDPRSGGKAATIRSGNERVLRARLADALFFWREDQKTPLESRVESLGGIVFHEKLGSLRQKAERMSELSMHLATQSGLEDVIGEAAARASMLCKCDLATQMVFEFPELQGVMGKHYAAVAGEPSSVRLAIEEHYKPRTAQMDLPRNPVSRLVALADKFDSIVGGFAAGLAPTGNKDPYALRRAALGIIAIIRTAKLFSKGPGLRAIIETVRELYRRQNILTDKNTVGLTDKVMAFFHDRLIQVLQQTSNAPLEVLRAVLATGFDNIANLETRLTDVSAFSSRPEFADLCTVVERVRNIVRKNQDVLSGKPEPQKSLLSEPAEVALFDVYVGTGVKFRTLIKNESYAQASEMYLKSFAAPLERFFEDVYVNVENKKIRRNRLALLACIFRMYAGSVADLAECAGRAKS